MARSVTGTSVCLVATVIVAACGAATRGEGDVGGAAEPPRERSAGANPEAVRQVAAGTRKEANAAWWGFDEKDATRPLQAALRSGARKVTVPDMGRPWVVGPVFLESDQEVVFEKGVVVQACEGSFLGLNDSLFTADDKENITLRGEGAEFVMRKQDYRRAPYPKGEWRMCLLLMSCRNIRVSGLLLKGSGGDGIYVGRSNTKGTRAWCEDIEIRDVVCDDNHRQGISVITAKNLLVENSRFQATEGTLPEAGIDFEPNERDECLTNCVVRNCSFTGNAGWGMLFALDNLGENPVSIRLENCTSDRNRREPLFIKARHAKGRIEFVGCEFVGAPSLKHGAGLQVEFRSAPGRE